MGTGRHRRRRCARLPSAGIGPARSGGERLAHRPGPRSACRGPGRRHRGGTRAPSLGSRHADGDGGGGRDSRIGSALRRPPARRVAGAAGHRRGSDREQSHDSRNRGRPGPRAARRQAGARISHRESRSEPHVACGCGPRRGGEGPSVLVVRIRCPGRGRQRRHARSGPGIPSPRPGLFRHRRTPTGGCDRERGRTVEIPGDRGLASGGRDARRARRRRRRVRTRVGPSLGPALRRGRGMGLGRRHELRAGAAEVAGRRGLFGVQRQPGPFGVAGSAAIGRARGMEGRSVRPGLRAPVPKRPRRRARRGRRRRPPMGARGQSGRRLLRRAGKAPVRCGDRDFEPGRQVAGQVDRGARRRCADGALRPGRVATGRRHAHRRRARHLEQPLGIEPVPDDRIGPLRRRALSHAGNGGPRFPGALVQGTDLALRELGSGIRAAGVSGSVAGALVERLRRCGVEAARGRADRCRRLLESDRRSDRARVRGEHARRVARLFAPQRVERDDARFRSRRASRFRLGRRRRRIRLSGRALFRFGHAPRPSPEALGPRARVLDVRRADADATRRHRTSDRGGSRTRRRPERRKRTNRHAGALRRGGRPRVGRRVADSRVDRRRRQRPRRPSRRVAGARRARIPRGPCGEGTVRKLGSTPETAARGGERPSRRALRGGPAGGPRGYISPRAMRRSTVCRIPWFR